MGKYGVLLLVAVMSFAGRSAADPVSDWNETAVTVMLRVPASARSILHDLAYVHIAIYDAVNAIDGRYSTFAVPPPNAAPWASKEAAVAAAARRVLVTFYPSEETYIDSIYAAAVTGLPMDSVTTRGVAIGDTVAALYLALRAGDGRDAIVTYTWQSPGPGVYQPTPPGASQYQPVGMWLTQFRPFVLSSPSELRAPDPHSDLLPPPGDLQGQILYAQVFNEVKRNGSRDSTFTSPEQREVARFHTENPNLLLARNIRTIATQEGMSLADNARFFAQMHVTIADALIAGFESKYFYNWWRPVTAIRAADTDDNPLTDPDTSWLPLVATPIHPEYPAAHGCGMGGLAYGMEKFFSTSNVAFTLSSAVTGTQHSFTSTDTLVAEVINARVWGGMHFRTSVEAGMEIARRTAAKVSERFAPGSSSPWVAYRAPGLPPSQNPDILLSAVNESICWGVKWDGAQFIRTTNGGISWTTSNVQGATGLGGSGIAAVDANTAWVTMYDPSSTTSGGVFKTTDGGTSWTKQPTAFPNPGGFPVDIHFFDLSNGIVIGNPNGGNWEIYVTTDGGSQWVQVPSADIPAPMPGDFTGQEGFAVAGNNIWFGIITAGAPGVYRSTDRGMSWTVAHNVPGRVGFSVAFKDSLNGLASSCFGGSGNRVARTTDGGITWTLLAAPSAPSTYFLRYVPGTPGTYVFTSSSNIGLPEPTIPGSAISEDDGSTWKRLDNLPHGIPAFASASIGWSAGVNDTVYRWEGIIESVGESSEIAQGFGLLQNYPNPFNPSTTIRYALPGRSQVTLTVFNTLGQQVATLVSGEQDPGDHQVRFEASGLASGVYFYRLQAGDFVQTKRLLLLR